MQVSDCVLQYVRLNTFLQKRTPNKAKNQSIVKLVQLLGNWLAKNIQLLSKHHQSGATGLLKTDRLMIEWVWKEKSFDCNLRDSS